MFDIGVIGAMDIELKALTEMLSDRETKCIGGIEFNTGTVFGKKVVIAKCGIGKVFAALAAEAMIIGFAPRLIVNTGVGGALSKKLRPLDVVIATSLVQYDMDTSAIGDPKGLISGINKVYFETDGRARELLTQAALGLGLNACEGKIATGDKFIAGASAKGEILDSFDADVCEMEGCAIAQVAYVNQTAVAVVRAISDTADESSSMDYMEFLPIAAENSAKLTLELIKAY